MYSVGYEFPTFDEAKQERSELVAECEQGSAGSNVERILLAKCCKGTIAIWTNVPFATT